MDNNKKAQLVESAWYVFVQMVTCVFRSLKQVLLTNITKTHQYQSNQGLHTRKIEGVLR